MYRFSYPFTYINAQFQRFFEKYLPSYSSLLLPLIENEEQFVIIREKLLAQSSIKLIIVNRRAATIDITTTHGNNTTETIQPPAIQSKIETMANEKDQNKFRSTIFFHCKHESRLTGIKRMIHEIHHSFFKNTPNEDIRLIVDHRNSPNIEFELSEKRPRPARILDDPLKKQTTK